MTYTHEADICAFQCKSCSCEAFILAFFTYCTLCSFCRLELGSFRSRTDCWGAQR